MLLRCPHCQNQVDIDFAEEEPLAEMTCPACGSTFHLISGESTETHRGAGSRTIAHFQLIEHLGQGHMGSVWKSLDTKLDRTVAVKIPRKEHLAPEDLAQFLREARAAAQLRHPNIVPVYEVGSDGGTVYLVSEYVQGLTLADWLTGHRPQPREGAELCAKLADAVHHAHESGVIHRDLKPSNILLDAQLEPHITDFGLAKREAGEVTITVEGKILGTPAYMSPEQALGAAHNADRRSDVYSLGVILYELLTGKRPFQGNVRVLLHQVAHDEPTRPRRLHPKIPGDLETICLKCLEKRPDRRYQTAGDLAADLRRWLNGEPILARRTGPVGRLIRWAHRNRLVASLSAISAVLLVASAFLLARVLSEVSTPFQPLLKVTAPSVADPDDVVPITLEIDDFSAVKKIEYGFDRNANGRLDDNERFPEIPATGNKIEMSVPTKDMKPPLVTGRTYYLRIRVTDNVDMVREKAIPIAISQKSVMPAKAATTVGTIQGQVFYRTLGDTSVDWTRLSVALEGTGLAADGDSNGKFTLKDVPFGQYKIRVEGIAANVAGLTGTAQVKVDKPVVRVEIVVARLPVPVAAAYHGTGEILWEPPKPQATVSVEGARKAAGYIVFILDYSGSMDVDVGGGAKGAAGAKIGTRYELARAGLGYLLNRLAKVPNNPYRVEVMLYGHRFGWTTSKLIQDFRFPPQTRSYTWDPQNPGSIIAADNLPGAVLPSEDVERLWPASWPPQHGLTEQETNKIEEILRRQRPLGDTPLYFAIQQAIRDLDGVPGNFAQPGAPSRHIVAITDGVNWQDFRRTDRVTRADVAVDESLSDRPDIRLDVMGFLLSDDREEAKKQLQEDAAQLRVDGETLVARYDELKGLVEKHKGRFYTVMDPTTLGAFLEHSVGLSRYVVYREGPGKPPPESRPQPKELGDAFDVPLARSDPQQADAALDWAGVPHAAELADSLLKARAQFWLRGDEGLRLYLSEDGHRLEHHFFDQEMRAKREFPHPRHPGRKLCIASHMPRREGDAVHFRFSVQNGRDDAWQFSPRPLEGWVEICPAPTDAKPGESVLPYVFYDLRFEPKQTVPVIECVVPDWPKGVHSAQVALWCKFERTDPEWTTAADQFDKPAQFAGISLDLQVEPDEKQDQFRIVLTERGHPPNSQLNKFRVEMRPLPLRVIHRYVPNAHTIRHTFVYPYAARSDPRSSFVVHLTSRAKSRNGAIGWDDVLPMIVAVPNIPR